MKPVIYLHEHCGGCRFLHSLQWLDANAARAPACVGERIPDLVFWYGNQATFAACAGDLPTLEYFHRHHPQLFTANRQFNAQVIAFWLVRGGHLNVSEWLYEHHREDFPWNEIRRVAMEKRQRPDLCGWLEPLEVQ